MDPIQKGQATEARVFHALRTLKGRYPKFVLEIRRAPPEMDARGIDCLVRIKLPESASKDDMTVPIEIKSSEWGVEKWKIVHSDLYASGVLIVFAPRDLSPRRLNRLLYRALKRVQKNSRDGTLYTSMWQRLFRGGSTNLWKNVEIIKEGRKKQGY